MGLTNSDNIDLEGRARAFARAAHSGQLRKYTKLPYVTHCAAVADIVREVPGCTEEMIAAAWLHDTVEDCGTRIEELFVEFGQEVANLVYWLTDVSKPFDGNRAFRKELDRKHLSKAPAQAQTVKIADLIDNTNSIVQYDPDFAKVYLKEKLALLDVLTEGDEILWMRAYKLAKESLPVS